MQHVLTLALGPVQEFLVAARRTRDLWFGSWLLSELARAAGEAIARHPGSRLVFPVPRHLADPDATFTNKVLAVCEGDPGALATAARAAVDQRLATLREEAFAGLGAHRPHFVEKTAIAQVADLIEVQWASAEMAKEADYKLARDQAEGLLGAAKNTRLWGPAVLPAAVPKSSIDGQRESVLLDELFDAQSGWTAEKLYTVFRVGEKERLCGVGLLKRRGKRRSSRFDHHFLSTGHLAAWPLLERITALAALSPEQHAELLAGWQAFRGALSQAGANLEEQRVYRQGEGHPILGSLDGSLLFENRLPDLFPDLPRAAERRKKAQPLQEQLRAFLKLTGGFSPCPYFAILVADGDHMGAAIDRVTEVGTHDALSGALSEFARQARPIVEKDHHGELVFAGGDDVLAFVPLHRAVSCARALAEDFRQRLSPFVGGDGTSPTLSVGVGVSHFQEPLSRALALARAAERAAKGLPGKNALAVSLDKRSGPALTVAGRWGELDPVLDAFVDLHVEDRVPDGLAYELRELARLGEGATGAQGEALTSLVHKEAERILRRKQPGHGEEANLEEETLKRLRESFRLASEELGRSSLAAAADALILARLLAEAQLQATPPKLDEKEKR